MDAARLIILDRDGVINQDSDSYVRSVDEWQPIKGSIEAIANLHKKGFTICVATNQSGIGRGYFDLDELEAMHRKLHALVEREGGNITGIAFCPHSPEDECKCRKPLTGLFMQIASQLGLSNLKGSYSVGDSLRDLEAAASSGCQPILVKTGKGMLTLETQKDKLPANTIIHDDLKSFAESI